MADNAINSYFFEKITEEWLVVKRKTLPTLPGVSCKNIKNVTKKGVDRSNGECYYIQVAEMRRQAEP